jgi:hypothetical protein
MITIKAFQNKVVFRSKYGEILPETDTVGIQAAMMSMRFKNEDVLFYEAKGKTLKDAEKSLEIYKKSVNFDGELKLEIINN